jgi:pimeloyl-ACP methyl ester carboxylesterase
VNVETIETGRLRMGYDVRGEGPPLLLVAGTGYPGPTWLPPFVEPLAERCTVIRFDHRGTGASGSTPDAYSTRQFAADAAALCRSLGFRTGVHVLGHSMGGRVAQWMALDAPELVGTLVLAASGPGQYRADRPLHRGVPLSVIEQLVERGYAGYMRAHIRDTFFTPAFAAERPDVVESLVSAFWGNAPTLRDYLKHIVARQKHQTAELLYRIRVPTLVVVGEEDTGVRGTGSHLEQSRHLAERLPRSRLVELAGVSHGYFWQWPERLSTLVGKWVLEHGHEDEGAVRVTTGGPGTVL